MSMSYTILYYLDDTLKHNNIITVDNEISGIDPYIDSDEKTLKVMHSATLLDSYTYDVKIDNPTYTFDSATNSFKIYVETLQATTYKFKHYSASSGGGENPLIATTDDEMLALDIVANNGKIVKFTGTSNNYETNGYYLIENN